MIHAPFAIRKVDGLSELMYSSQEQCRKEAFDDPYYRCWNAAFAVVIKGSHYAYIPAHMVNERMVVCEQWKRVLYLFWMRKK